MPILKLRCLLWQVTYGFDTYETNLYPIFSADDLLKGVSCFAGIGHGNIYPEQLSLITNQPVGTEPTVAGPFSDTFRFGLYRFYWHLR